MKDARKHNPFSGIAPINSSRRYLFVQHIRNRYNFIAETQFIHILVDALFLISRSKDATTG
jgi:hypothetical protein